MAEKFRKFQDVGITNPARFVYVLEMQKGPENRINEAFAQNMIAALRYVETELLAPDTPGAVIISSFSNKFWSTGLDLHESERNPLSEPDGFYPLLATLLDYPFPTVALVTGHAFGGACPLALACDYRIMNSKRGFFNMPPIDVGKHFEGIGALPRLKLHPKIARKMLLESHRWTSAEALKDGIVDEICDPERMLARAVEIAQQHAPRAKMGVYSLLRTELWGEALGKLKSISYVHGRRVGVAAKAMI